MSRIKKQTLIALILIQTITSVNGQVPNTSSENRPKILYLTKKDGDSKPHYILENKKIKIILKDGSKLKGTFEINSDSSILMSNQNLPFDAIAILKKPKKGLRIFGAILGSLTGILFPVGIGSAYVLIFEPFYASPLYLLAASKRFDLINDYNLYVLKSDS
jgi:hypothetical protein